MIKHGYKIVKKTGYGLMSALSVAIICIIAVSGGANMSGARESACMAAPPFRCAAASVLLAPLLRRASN